VGQESKLSVSDISQLLDVVTQVAEEGQCTPSEAVKRIAGILSPDTACEERDRAKLAEFVAGVRRLRMRRNELIGAPLFRDAAWDMLLELFAAHQSRRRLSVSSLCYASGVPPTTALRQLQRLEKYGLLTRVGDSEDSRRCFVEPTAKAIAGVAMVAGMLLDQSQAVETAAAEQGSPGAAVR
jgi:hypothetical protein